MYGAAPAHPGGSYKHKHGAQVTEQEGFKEKTGVLSRALWHLTPPLFSNQTNQTGSTTTAPLSRDQSTADASLG